VSKVLLPHIAHPQGKPQTFSGQFSPATSCSQQQPTAPQKHPPYSTKTPRCIHRNRNPESHHEHGLGSCFRGWEHQFADEEQRQRGETRAYKGLPESG
jgi:hypothetical protein